MYTNNSGNSSEGEVEVKRLFIGAGCNRIVNNVSWGACDLVSFGAQNAVAIFCPKTAQILITLPGHKASVNCTHWIPSNKFAFRGECKLSCVETLFVGSKPMVSLSLAELPGNSGYIVLAMGGLDSKVHLYCGERTGKFIHACELKAHTDWIRSLDFSLPIFMDGEANSILLVSSSQDKGIRIWKMALRVP
ncbi:hypothetical protein GH714_018673 [Hevea brasiliensis]|uniref:Elongator complex protein 2 n=1 Tax=Hevea brasiliensis TaxID=3981 RepID=A0A6A6MBA6_HEVBR|nr:hypothetical protein GH714_018673 [Hevea brasiliensis]